MERKPVLRRIGVPVLVVTGTMALSSLAYRCAVPMNPGTLRDLVIGLSWPVTFASVWFFALVGPPLAYVAGARFAERLAIAFVFVGQAERWNVESQTNRISRNMGSSSGKQRNLAAECSG